MLIERNGEAPRVHTSAQIAPSATIVGNVQIGARAHVDHAAVIASGGPPIEIAGEVIVLPGAIIRSVGGTTRPAFAVRVGEQTLISPLCVLTGCTVGRNYIAVPTADGFLSTADVERAREAVAAIDFFETAFGAGANDQANLHAKVMATLLDEVHSWRDEPFGQLEEGQ